MPPWIIQHLQFIIQAIYVSMNLTRCSHHKAINKQFVWMTKAWTDKPRWNLNGSSAYKRPSLWPINSGPNSKTQVQWIEIYGTFIRVLFFLAFNFCRFCVVIQFFSSLPQRPMTSQFVGFSIPDFIHYIYFPILILENVQC